MAGEREFFCITCGRAKGVKKFSIPAMHGFLTSLNLEAVWKDCVQAIGQACKRARERKRKNTSEGHV